VIVAIFAANLLSAERVIIPMGHDKSAVRCGPIRNFLPQWLSCKWFLSIIAPELFGCEWNEKC